MACHITLRQIAFFFFMDSATQLKSKLWPCSPTFQMACVLSTLMLVSIRFICLLLPYFPIIALASCSLGQSYMHWIGHSESPHFSRSFLFTHAAIVFKFQLRMRARSLSEACQNQPLWMRRAAWSGSLMLPIGLPPSGKEVSFPAPLGPIEDSKGSIR